MSKSITEAILFSSRHSAESAPCEQIIAKTRLPIEIVHLDSASARDAAMRGTNIQIKSVPSLIISYSDGTVQMYVGKPKVFSWIQMTLQSIQPPQNQSSRQSIAPPTADKETVLIHDENDMGNEIDTGYDDGEEIEYIKPKSKKPKKKKNNGKLKGNKNNEHVEIVIDDEQAQPQHQNVQSHSQSASASQTKGFATGPRMKVQNTELMAAAQRMMSERDATLGYKADK